MNSESFQMVWPGGGSVAVFVSIVAAVSTMLVLGVRRAFEDEGRVGIGQRRVCVRCRRYGSTREKAWSHWSKLPNLYRFKYVAA